MPLTEEQSTLTTTGLKKDATVEEKAQANAIIAYAHRARVIVSASALVAAQSPGTIVDRT